MEALQQLGECCLFTNTNLRVSHVKSIHYHHSTGGRGEGGRTRNEIHGHLCLLPTRASPEKIFMMYYYMHVYIYIIYVRFYLSRGERKTYMTGNLTGPKRKLMPNSVNSKSSSQVYRFRPGTESLSLSVEFGPKAPQCPPQAAQAAAPTSFISAFPWDTEAHSRKERSVRPQRGG